MADSIIFRADGIRSLAFGSISGTYANIGTFLDHTVRQIMVTNTTDQLLMFSFNPTGTTPDHFVVPASTSMIIDITANKTEQPGWFIQKRTQMGVRDLGSAASSGTVYISAFFGKGQ